MEWALKEIRNMSEISFPSFWTTIGFFKGVHAHTHWQCVNPIKLTVNLHKNYFCCYKLRDTWVTNAQACNCKSTTFVCFIGLGPDKGKWSMVTIQSTYESFSWVEKGSQLNSNMFSIAFQKW